MHSLWCEGNGFFQYNQVLWYCPSILTSMWVLYIVVIRKSSLASLKVYWLFSYRKSNVTETWKFGLTVNTIDLQWQDSSYNSSLSLSFGQKCFGYCLCYRYCTTFFLNLSSKRLWRKLPFAQLFLTVWRNILSK